MNSIRLTKLLILILPAFVTAINIQFIGDLLKTFDYLHHFIYFGCSIKESLKVTKLVHSIPKYYHYTNIKEKITVDLRKILGYKYFPPGIILIDCSCENAGQVLQKASELKSFNKTYEWIIIDENSFNALDTLNQSMEVGLNAQILYINKTQLGTFELYDIYSQGRHLGSPMNVTLFGKWSYKEKLKTVTSLQEMRSIIHRGQFNMLKLRGVLVLDKENLTTNEQVYDHLGAPDYKTVGMFSMIKYASELVRIIGDRLNFTVDYRVTKGWAGRLGNTTYRLGLMGVVQRGEVDIAASPSFIRISRFNDLDLYHQGWDFDAGFVYIYSNLVKHSLGSGNFLAPFHSMVWVLSFVSLIVIAIIWKYLEVVSQKISKQPVKGREVSANILLQSVAAVCQQGLDPAPKATTTRIIAFSLIIFSVLMYNYYTSSVVGGLISNNEPGIRTLEELINSNLKLAFEDIGYNKVVMTEKTDRLITMKIRKKFYSQRESKNYLEGFTSRSKAIPYIRAGTHAFHCEFVSINGELAKNLDANEICNLRTIRGLLEHSTLAMVLTKKSQYLEMFKLILTRAREIGVIRLQEIRIRGRPPKCQGALTVLPVALPGVFNAFFLLIGGMIFSVVILLIEIVWVKYQFRRYRN